MDVTLETERLRMRMFTEADFDTFASILADPEVMTFLGEGVPIPRDDAWRRFAFLIGHWHLRGYGMCAVEEKSSGQVAGHVGVFYPEGWPELEVGWTLHRDFQGKGYATEAGAAAMDWCFTELGREKVSSVIRPGNERSIRVAEKLGETFEREVTIQNHPCLIYSISRDTWQTRRAQDVQKS